MTGFWSRLFGRPGQPAIDRRRAQAETEARLIAGIPFERIETTGRDALESWEGLRREGRGWPVVVGGDNELARLAEQLQFAGEANPEAILAAAAGLRFPEALHQERAAEKRRLADYVEKQRREGKKTPFDAVAIEEEDDPPVGDWPSVPGPSAGLSLARDLRGQPLSKVHILLLPTGDGTEAPALLRWGGWNECPSPEVQVAALRSWRERYGVELIGIGADVLNLRAKRRPQTREEALALAREQCLYCSDIVFQGTDTLSNLAATLMADDWWYFWWD